MTTPLGKYVGESGDEPQVTVSQRAGLERAPLDAELFELSALLAAVALGALLLALV